ncbi:MAG: glycosyltransferase [Planctomycetes bacterium]|nr:glycosyltransferase [Planctomycetota bacterium]
MKVLMLGWEFPPHHSGGLGTACHGLTVSLAARGVRIVFVLPRLLGGEPTAHMELREGRAVFRNGAAPPRVPSRETPRAESESATPVPPASAGREAPPAAAGREALPVASTGESEEIEFFPVRSALLPYLSPAEYLEVRRLLTAGGGPSAVPGLQVPEDVAPGVSREEAAVVPGEPSAPAEHYGRDLFAEVARYSLAVAALAREIDFDIVHAHDWMTYPAALAVKRNTGKPIVLHVHSLEYDRSGLHPNRRIAAIEREGLRAADRVIAVSHYTRGVILEHHALGHDRISVVHNGITRAERIERFKVGVRPSRAEKIVLFLGRVTFQKGPDYFVEAAARVVPHYPNTRFVMAGTGDMLGRMVERVVELGLSDNFQFTGFLRGSEVERMFTLADVFVMPSVSEPFGIAPLEAVNLDTPVIISRQSGVSEVLRHALRVDFWDVERLAELILAVLSYPAIGADMAEMGSLELDRLRWDAAAEKVEAIYEAVLRGESCPA